LRFGRVRVGQRPIAGDHQIGTEQKIRLFRQTKLDAVGEKSDGADARHRQHERRDQYA
jgi:hypothetical protein